MILHQRWTQTHITELRDRVQSGETAGEIVAAMGRTAADITGMMRRLRL